MVVYYYDDNYDNYLLLVVLLLVVVVVVVVVVAIVVVVVSSSSPSFLFYINICQVIQGSEKNPLYSLVLFLLLTRYEINQHILKRNRCSI